MLTTEVKRYLILRETLGYKMKEVRRHLLSFARFADEKGETHVRSQSVVAWAEQAPSPNSRKIRFRQVVKFAQFLQAEDATHEIPSLYSFHHQYERPLPYIYSKEEIGKMMGAAAKLQKCYPLRKETYGTLIGLIASTGLRISEALNLRFSDIMPDGTLYIRRTKFGKSRLVPLHESVLEKLQNYLILRQNRPTTDDHVFISAHNTRLASSTVNYTFRGILKIADVAPTRKKRPRIHDLRHTFATRALEKCATDRGSVAKNFVALSTYLGHVDIKQTYWYLEATPDLMNEIAVISEVFAMGGEK